MTKAIRFVWTAILTIIGLWLIAVFVICVIAAFFALGTIMHGPYPYN